MVTKGELLWTIDMLDEVLTENAIARALNQRDRALEELRAARRDLADAARTITELRREVSALRRFSRKEQT